MDILLHYAKNSPESLFRAFNTTASGLSEKEVSKRLKIYGLNHLTDKRHFVIAELLWKSFFSPLVLLLLAASLVSSFLGDIRDFTIIFSIVVLSGGITFYQHFKADTAAEKLKKKVQLFATALRGGIQKEVPFATIVPGDIVLLTPGEVVPADGRIIMCKDFAIDESTLTGESFPSEKSLHFSENSHTFSGLSNMVFGGTHVVSGEATVIVVTTGKLTQLGQLAKEMSKSKPATDFDRGITKLSYLMIQVIILLCLFVFGVNALLHHEILTSFTFALALAVGLTPELMPVILTINLSRGALRMERKEVIVKYLPAIQNFGSMDVLCTDKTGTLTENTISLTDYQNISEEKDERILLLGALDASLKSGLKDPLDHALLHHEHPLPLQEYKKIDEIPFDFIRKRASVIVKNTKNHYVLITKGAPQKVLPLCSNYMSHDSTKVFTQALRNKIDARINQLNKDGFRVLVVASKKIQKKSTYPTSDETMLTFAGLLVFTDTVKLSVQTAVKNLEVLGISIKILTGDNELVTEKVCADAHIHSLGTLVGDTIDTMSDSQLEAVVDTTTIFARLTPEQKARIIYALKRKNHVVGYLGDGVNDAPPLKAADVGISVNNGSDIARDVADIVLMRKSLSVLREGVVEGRKTHVNIFKYIFMSLSSNFGNMISVAVASLFLPFLPLLPFQILLIDFLYDFSQITVPTDNVDKEAILSPQKWDIGFVKKFMLSFGPLSSLFDIATFIGLLLLFHASIPLFRTGWFLESVITQTVIIFVIRTRKIPFFRSLASLPVIATALLTILCGLLLTATKLGTFFTFVTLPKGFSIFLVVVILLYITIVEVGKVFFYKYLVK